MTRTGLLPPVLAAGWAATGLLGGHLLTYRILFPDAHRHDAVLAESGHAWTALLVPAFLVALVVAIAAGLLGRRRAGDRRVVRFGVLALLQVALFLALEIGERVAGGMTFRTLPHELAVHHLGSTLAVGVAIQLLAAWLGSALSRAVARVAERLGRPGPFARPRPVQLPLPVIRLVRPTALVAGGIRGPPTLRVTPPA